MANLCNELQSAFKAEFPVKIQHGAQLEFVDVVDLGDGRYGVTMRLVVWETDSQGRESVRDVKEQELRANFTKLAAVPGRIASFVRAHAAVLRQIAIPADDLACMMPMDLMSFQPLLLARPTSAEEFALALSAKSRLGKYLPTAQA